MNKYIEEYITRRKEEIAEEERLAKQAQKDGLVEKLKLGKREYQSDFPEESETDFPYYDSVRNEYYRCNIGEVSDEDYLELLKYVPADDKPKEAPKKSMSGWHTFAVIMMILGCLAGAIEGLLEDGSIIVAIGIVLGVLIFFSQIILLCKIEYNTRDAE